MTLKQALQKKQLTIGTWLSIGDEIVAEIVSSSGFDWIAVDMEHGPIDYKTLQNVVRIIDLSGCIPLVRIASHDPVHIRRVMDTGVEGIIVPMVNKKLFADLAIASMHYPPKGSRGLGLARAQMYGEKVEEYIDMAGKDAIVVAQIEHIDAIKDIQDIARSDVDALFLGPYDLSASMGIPGKFLDVEFMSAVEKFEEACKKLDKPIGYHVVDSNDHNRIQSCVKKGYSFLAVGLDTMHLTKASKGAASFVRKVCENNGKLPYECPSNLHDWDL